MIEPSAACPRRGPSNCPSVYSFRYGNAGIISLDANELSWEIQGLLGYSHGAQARWLGEQLHAWRSGSQVDFIVAFFHECAFSTCNGHSSDGGVRATLAPLFARHQVDLVVQGHNHVYERTNPLIYDPKTNSARSSIQAVSVSPTEPAEVQPAKDGTTYVVVGTAGTPRYGWTGRHETGRNFAAGQGSGMTVAGDAKRRVGLYVSERDFSLPTRPSIGLRPGTATTASSRSTSPRPRQGRRPRWCCDSSTSRARSWTGWCSPGSPAGDWLAGVLSTGGGSSLLAWRA